MFLLLVFICSPLRKPHVHAHESKRRWWAVKHRKNTRSDTFWWLNLLHGFHSVTPDVWYRVNTNGGTEQHHVTTLWCVFEHSNLLHMCLASTALTLSRSIGTQLPHRHAIKQVYYSMQQTKKTREKCSLLFPPKLSFVVPPGLQTCSLKGRTGSREHKFGKHLCRVQTDALPHQHFTEAPTSVTPVMTVPTRRTSSFNAIPC